MVEFKSNSDKYGPLMDMHPHTRGKLDLLDEYYKRALPIFSQQALKKGGKVIVVDAFCGSGKYEEGSDGSPIVILRNWNEFLQGQKNNNQAKMKNLLAKIDFVFNDNDPDTIQSLEDRIKNDADLDWLLSHVTFENKDYKDLLTDLVMTAGKYNYGSYFIDPYGYNDINIDEIAGLAHLYGHEVIVNWMFENIAKYMFANKANDPESDHPATIMLNDMFGRMWKEQISENDDLVSRKQKLTLLFEQKTKEKIDNLGQTGYVIPFMFYKDGERVWYPMFHISTSGRGAQTFNSATKRIGGNLKRYHPEKTKEDVGQLGLDGFFDDTEQLLTSADKHIKDNIEFFKTHMLDIFSYDQTEIEIGNIPSEFLRVYPRRSPEGNSKIPVEWINDIIPSTLQNFPNTLSIKDWDGQRRIKRSDILQYNPEIE